MTAHDLLYTTHQNNGHTLWLDSQIRSGGYVVAYGPGFILPDWIEASTFEWFFNRLKKEMRGNGDGIGTWMDGEVLYLDAVRHIETLEEALRLGQSANQITIYSIAEELVIDVDEVLSRKSWLSVSSI